IDMSVFDNTTSDDLQSQLDNMPDNPDDTSGNGIDNFIETTVYYTLYEQDNYFNKYTNSVIKNSYYGYGKNNEILNTANDKLSAITGRFGESDIFNIWVDPAFLSNPSSNPNNWIIGLKQRSKSEGDAKSGTLGWGTGTESDSESYVLNQYVDLNGDRYPD